MNYQHDFVFIHATFAESLELQESKPRRVKQDPDIKDSPGTEPAKYYAKDAKGKEMSKAHKTGKR